MKLTLLILIIFATILPHKASATVKAAFEIYKNDKTKNKNKNIAHELIEGGFFF